MVSIPTPIPQSTATSIKHFFTGRFVEVVWRVSLLAAFLLLLYALASAGGGVLAAFVVFTLGSIVLKDEVRDMIWDIYNRDFWVWDS